MAYIIGTAGHVDHGKTALIHALTGIDADTLPEEKKRGMTIDLGFAHFTADNGETIGIIDVPGHERFIRNMVAGAWSLSLAMLVVASDEGWMQQTEDHARVLIAMGIEEILCVMTKTDLVDGPVQSVSIEETGKHLQGLFGEKIDIMSVSSHTGEGIEELRSSLVYRLNRSKSRRLRDTGSPYIHIDRAFSVKGSGTVVTGSLAGAKLREGDELTILPPGIRTRVRGIQAYHSLVKEAEPVSRVACNLHGIKKEELKRGYIAALNPDDFWTGREFILQWKVLDETRKGIRNHMELELACGTGHYTGRIHFLKTPGYARVVLNETLSTNWLDSSLFISQGGHHILAKGRFIWDGPCDYRFRKKLDEVLSRYPVGKSVKNHATLRLLLAGWVCIEKSTEKDILKKFSKTESYALRFTASCAITEDLFQKEIGQLIRHASQSGGISRAEYSQTLKFPVELSELLINEALKSGSIITKEQLLITPDQLGAKAPLSPLGRTLIHMMNVRHNKGLQFKEIKLAGARKELRDLIRMGRVLALQEDIFYSIETFNRLSEQILEGRATGELFSIPEAKERTELSRRYIIPLLNKMEEKGLVKRFGDKRMVL